MRTWREHLYSQQDTTEIDCKELLGGGGDWWKETLKPMG